ncbi:uncharacterized protein RCO7_03448 [Rhynchosporium graminicola]|uniref:Uncharacterized protein n=1 Tax=Rhynchosporium graminicola TaxID=2792576 RepID=A0A1E1LDY3_9HELO|nr:uncharacterized protein RCO7_03448 [Rhynchosporium commune]
MAKTVLKRKSESALPTGKSKHRKTSARKEDGSDSGEEGSSDQLFVVREPVTSKDTKKRSVKSRKSEPVKPSSRVDEYEEDEGRTESRQFLALVEFESKKKKRAAKAAAELIERFENRINDAEESLKKRLHDLSTEASKKDSDFNEAFEDAYAASRPLPPTANGGSKAKGLSKDISFATLFDRSLEIIDGAKLIIEKFEMAREKTNKIEIARLMDNNWSEENDDIAKILATGHMVGLEKYEAMLMGSGEPDIEEEDLELTGLFYPDTEVNTYIPWGGMARKGEKAMRKLLKAIVTEVV